MRFHTVEELPFSLRQANLHHEVMNSATWFILIGIFLITMTVLSAELKRVFLTAAMVYVAIGVSTGKVMLGIISVDPIQHASLLRILTEIAVTVSLFTAGLKLRLPLNALEWRTPLLLASLSMALTVLLTALAAYLLFRLPAGACLLLGGILAPTDPVLASAVHVLGPGDRDRLRFSLTAEAGLNDGTAFPFVLLGLGILGLRDVGPMGTKWIIFDLLWGPIGGLGIGTLLATGVSKLVSYLRKRHEETESLDDFLAIGLIALSYGISESFRAYGFLAVFAAGLAIRRAERNESQSLREAIQLSKSHARRNAPSGQMANAVLKFNEQLEHLGEFAVVILLGAMLSPQYFHFTYLWMVPLLFLLIRPISILLSVRSRVEPHKGMLAWFGIRGIGSLYYLSFAIEQGLSNELAVRLAGITTTVIIASIVVHGLSATPLMLRYVAKTR